MLKLNHFVNSKDSQIIENAITYLVEHINKSGKNSKPVILHSVRVASALLMMGYEREIIVGALLHDVLEDTDVDEEQLENDFDSQTLSLVKAVSYDESIVDPVEQYKDMYNRILQYGRNAVVVKSIDIADNSLYIDLVPDEEKRKQLVDKGTYFLNLTEEFSSEPAWQLLKDRNLEEIAKLS